MDLRPSAERTGASPARRSTQLAHRLVQNVGVDILVVFLLLAGVILLTGASLASVIRATGSGVDGHDPDGAQAARAPRTGRAGAPLADGAPRPERALAPRAGRES